MKNTDYWKRYKKYLYVSETLGLMIDISRMKFTDAYMKKMEPLVQKAFDDMQKLESGAIANPDEGRMVGHYWLRNAALAPDKAITSEIEDTLSAIKEFSHAVHTGKIVSENGATFKNVLVIGIGGSALGPQFAASAIGTPNDPMTVYFFDNTDPDGMDFVLGQINQTLGQTLSLVISKSGSTLETRNGMLEAKRAYESMGLNFAKHAVAVTGKDSKLDKIATTEGWLKRFPMWDWVGGRTSETSAVGLLPAALQGLDIDSILKGARQCDEATRTRNPMENPSAILALMWHYATKGKGTKDMVILPYKDRLSLFTKYLQQLIMESLGKEKDLDGNIVHQGISVYGNKGSTDQHAYIQQLRDGVNNFFVTFVEVLKDREGESMFVEGDFTTGDYLSAFALGTRSALTGSDRESMTITIEKIDAFSLGILIALYERAVGFYASLININAYHQPGVEAGKKAAGSVVTLQHAVLNHLKCNKGKAFSADETAAAIEAVDDAELVFKILLRASHNAERKIIIKNGKHITSSRFQYTG
ncbi:glucose-6-phosphate isomerase [Candidatus Magnetominusculus xianensis]|uniref:Glucose-6-phosphate isomerase n=1 Tax=Candidatus Magnetominusculus xianensis TaxID=1748249 RepID=A0ABR5SL55_9BACT|nr:glucose-6-phosphate isomerase [Candidatus Magnetominusculus xianensis]KWT90495.1 glucose-6-phosphate isomerase [Candidatus Magnetominusculus xianensis]MBF0404179.1 glucose-6-phosphate isomerase [Nitrospirota bacterium]